MSQQFPYAANDDAPPIDLEFLKRQTQGNRLLQQELLLLFREQLSETHYMLAQEPVLAHRENLHAIRGAALNLGAFSLAEELRKLDENAGLSTDDAERSIVRTLQFVENLCE